MPLSKILILKNNNSFYKSKSLAKILKILIQNEKMLIGIQKYRK